MIYFIGGPPRTGKSLLAQKFITKKPMSSFSCDFTYDIDQIREIPGFAKMDIIEKGEAYFPLLNRLVFNVNRQAENCLIEGEVILPRHVAELAIKYKVRACFIGLSSTTIGQIISNGGHFNWPKYKLENNLQREIIDLVELITRRSKIIEDECLKYNLHYLDLAQSFDSTHNKALKYLLQEN